MDLISRKEAIDVLNVGAELLKRVLDDADIVSAERAKYEWGLELIESYISDMNELPSAEPERMKGKWIEMGTNKDGTHNIKCSKCGEGYKTRGHARSIATKAKYSFCPNCGASMVRGEEE